ncbi:MAG: S9 family peptidase [Steroidobacteraceae bacterium]
MSRAAIVSLLIVLPCLGAMAGGRAFEPEDFYRIVEVGDVQLSPDGQWVAYIATSNDRASDEPRSALWLVSWDARQHVQVTRNIKDINTPRFSPDGLTIAAIGTPAGADKPQILLFDRRGGEPRVLGQAGGEVGGLAWSPDGTRLLWVERTGPAAQPAGEKAPHPIVIDAAHFKQDISGYVQAGSSQHLQLTDVASGRTQRLTDDASNWEDHPAWSPDGRHIAYVRTDSPDRSDDGSSDLLLADATGGHTPRVLAHVYPPNTQRLAFSPDGRQLAYLQGLEPRLYAYIADELFVLPVSGGAPRSVTSALDRALLNYAWQADGRGFIGVVEDDQSSYPALIDASSGKMQRLVSTPMTTLALSRAGGRVALVASTDHQPGEVMALEGHSLRKLSGHNDALLSELALAPVEDLSFNSADGTEVHGMMIRPANFDASRRYPTIAWIHGGPNGHDDHSLLFDGYPLQLERQFLAAQGYVVLAINYRGGSGRGAKFQRAIAGDWCHLEVEDLHAGLEHVISRGIADPARLGVGGWSYGGILTDCMIAAEPRLKAAVSGAGSANSLSLFGSDQYVWQYMAELGAPWKTTDLWIKVSAPFFHADRIRTPTLFMGGEKDFNVPIAGGEQMYQALRVQGIPAQLVIYPEQFHIFTRPSFIVDRARRVRDWYARYLK